MEPVWRLADSVERDEQFSLAASFTLATAADAFVWSDFLGAPTYLARVQGIGGQYTDTQRLSGRYQDVKRLEGDI